MSHKYETIHLDLHPKQMMAVAHGKATNIKHHQIHVGHPVVLKKSKARRIAKAHANGKGARFSLDHEEMGAQHEGSGFLDALRSAGDWLKKNIIDTNFYQQNIKPIVKQGVDFGVNTIANAVGSKVPFLAPVAQEAGKFLTDKVGNATGAFGLHHHRPVYGGTLLVDNSMHRGNYSKGNALNPALPPQDFSRPNYALHRVKGSDEAKEHMMKIRAMRKPRGTGGGIVSPGYN